MKVCFIKYKKIVALLAVTIILIGIMVFPNISKAANTEGSVTWKDVSQEINTSNQYVYDGSKTDFSMPRNVLRKTSDGNWYYIENGVVTAKSGLFANKNGWYNVQNGKVVFLTGVSKAADGSWYDFGSGEKRQFTTNKTVAKNDNGWWYLVDGRVDFSYTGFAANENGIWYVQGGQVDFSYNDVVKDTTGIVKYNAWIYFSGGKFNPSFTGIASNSNGRWYVRNGIVDFSYTGYIPYNGTRYHIVGGKVQ